MNNEELAKEYWASLQLVSGRLKVLRCQLNEVLHNKEMPKHERKIQASELRDRIRPLYAMQRDLRGVYYTIKNYYKPGWWKDENYTCTTRKTRRTVFYFGEFYE